MATNMAESDQKGIELSHVDKPEGMGQITDPYDFESRSEEWHREATKKLLRKVDLRLLPMLCLMFLMSYLDRRLVFLPPLTSFGS